MGRARVPVMEKAEAAMRACMAVPEGERPRLSSGLGSMTPEELEEWRRVPGNEGVRAPSRPRAADPAMRPSPVSPMRVLVRLAPVPGVPMVARETLAVFVDTRDHEMAESVAEAVLHARGLSGEVVE